MNSTQLPFLVEGGLILIAMTFGFLLDRTGKPFGKVKVILHLFFATWFTVGFAFILYALSTVHPVKTVWIPVCFMGLAILTQLTTGILMLVSKSVVKTLVKIHLTSAILLLVSDICAFFLLA